jgi:hypothetical protein
MKTNLLIGACLLLAIPSADALAVITVSIPTDLTAQPGDAVFVPVFLSDGTSITDVTIDLFVDFTRLDIIGEVVNPALSGATFSVTTAGSGTAGTATLVFHNPTGLPSGSVELGELVSSVPNTAPLGPTTLHLDLFPAVNGGRIPAFGVDGMVTIVPEPSTYSLLSLGSLSFILWRRISRKKHFGTASSS